MINVGQAGVDLGAVLGTWGQLRVGPVWSRVDAHVDTGSPALPSVKETTAGLRAALFVDQTNHAFFPTEGFGFVGTAYAAMTSFGSAENYERLEGSARFIHSWGPHTLNFAVSGGTALGSDMPAYEAFALGGPLRLSGYRINQFSGREYAFGRVMYYNRVFPLPDILRSGVYVGASAEVAWITNRFDSSPSPGTPWSGSGFLGADTILGPAFLGAGFGGAGHWNIYLLLGAP